MLMLPSNIDTITPKYRSQPGVRVGKQMTGQLEEVLVSTIETVVISIHYYKYRLHYGDKPPRAFSEPAPITQSVLSGSISGDSFPAAMTLPLSSRGSFEPTL